MKKIGLFYAAKAEKTSWVAERIQKEFGESHIEVVPIEQALSLIHIYRTVISSVYSDDCSVRAHFHSRSFDIESGHVFSDLKTG